MCEKTSVESAQCLPGIGADHHAGAAAPEYVLRDVVLSFVLFRPGEDASAAETVTEAVDQSARRTGIFETVPLLVAEDFGPAGGAVFVQVHPFFEGEKPVPFDQDIRVEQQIIPGVRAGESPVVAFCKTVIAGKTQDLDAPFKGAFHIGDRAVDGVVVGYRHSCVVAFEAMEQRGKKAFEVLLAVPVEDDDGRFHYLFVVTVPLALSAAPAVAVSLSATFAVALVAA